MAEGLDVFVGSEAGAAFSVNARVTAELEGGCCTNDRPLSVQVGGRAAY